MPFWVAAVVTPAGHRDEVHSPLARFAGEEGAETVAKALDGLPAPSWSGYRDGRECYVAEQTDESHDTRVVVVDNVGSPIRRYTAARSELAYEQWAKEPEPNDESPTASPRTSPTASPRTEKNPNGRTTLRGR